MSNRIFLKKICVTIKRTVGKEVSVGCSQQCKAFETMIMAKRQGYIVWVDLVFWQTTWNVGMLGRGGLFDWQQNCFVMLPKIAPTRKTSLVINRPQTMIFFYNREPVKRIWLSPEGHEYLTVGKGGSVTILLITFKRSGALRIFRYAALHWVGFVSDQKWRLEFSQK